MLCQEIKEDKQFQAFILNCFSVIYLLDAGGLNLTNIFTFYPSN